MAKNLLYLFIFIGAGCFNQSDSDKISNTFWATEATYEKSSNEFTPNLIFSFINDTASIHQFGTGEVLFKLPYIIKNDEIYLDGKKNSFMKFLKKNDEILVNLFPGDTTKIIRLYPNSNSEGKITKELLYHSFILKNDQNDSRKIMYFDKEEILVFSKDIENDKAERVYLTFKRIPYSLDFTNEIPTITIGNLRRPQAEFFPNGDFELTNLIMGEISLKESNEIEIRSFASNKIQTSRLSKIEKRSNETRLTSGEWKRGDYLKYTFLPTGKVEVIDKKRKREMTWRVDNSGYLIIMEKKSGEISYAIKNFEISDKRIGLEFSKGKFGDIMNLK